MRFFPISRVDFRRAVLTMACLILASGQTVDFPPTVFTQQPLGSPSELRGNKKVLMCSANGSPNPAYRWIKDGTSLSQNSTDMSLQIRSVQLTDAGIYQCIASNELGALLSNQAVLYVAYMVPYNASRDSVVVSVVEGHAAIITLPPLDCVPAPAIQWIDGAYVITGESQRYHVTLSNQLVVLETRNATDNNKMLKATATNSFVQQSTDSPTYLLSIQGDGNSQAEMPPEFVVAPNATTAMQGDDLVKLECIVNARPLNRLSISWFRKVNSVWEVIQLDNIKYQLSSYRRTLTIRNPTTSDTGTYQCKASFDKPGTTNQVPPITAEANLTVYVKPSFVITPPSEIDVDMGLSVVLNCQALGIPPPTAKWYRNTALISNSSNGHYQLMNNGSLKMLRAATNDSGVFQCFVKNDAGELSTATWLRVGTAEPEMVTLPQNASVIAGDSARFTCEARGAPRPSILWSRVTSGVLSELKTSTAHIQVLDSELLIPVTDISDEGIYICNASNMFGKASAEAFLTVTIRTRIVLPPQNLSVIKSLNALFPCGVANDPSVSVVWHWFLGSAEMPSADLRQRILSDGSLEIRSVRNMDVGTYTCIVISNGGNDTASAALKVIELPYPPDITSVQLSPGSNRSVDIAWVPGFDGLSPVRNFILRFRIVIQSGTEAAWQVAASSIPPDRKSYTLNDLRPARSYQFTISAVNDVGESQPSNPSSVISLPQQPPSGPPRFFTGSPRSNSSILLQWQAPDPDLINGNLLGYFLRYKPSGYPDSTLSNENITTSLENVVYELRGLIVFQEYEISVAAFNAKGVGVFGGSLFIRTFEGTPSLPPTGLAVVAVSSTAFNISWLPPNPQNINGINQGYKIFAQEVNGTLSSRVTSVVLSNTVNMLGRQTAYLTDLRKFKVYSVAVLCFTSQGDGPLSAAVTAQTLEDVPDPVSNLTFANIMDTSLTIVWLPPVNTNGILTGYTVTYVKKNSSEAKVTVQLHPAVLNYTITSLAPTTAYTIEVWANTKAGSGDPRSADIQSGITPVLPSPPMNLAVTDIRARSVELRFVPGFNGYTSISRWIIEGQTSDGISENSWTIVYSISSPDASVLTVLGLTPFMRYRLRVVAVNIAGRSNASEATHWFNTLQAVPSAPPSDVTVRVINATALNVRWTALSAELWNGESRGYVVQWKLRSSVNFSNSVNITDENANSFQLSGLRKWTKYEVRVAASNSIGLSDYSATVTGQTLESTPASGPVDITATTMASTVIQVSWGNVSVENQNGLILGYKVVYNLVSSPADQALRLINDSSLRSFNVTGLKKFAWYSFQVLAYTGVGDGVRSQPPVLAMTLEDVPGPPASVYFPQVMETSTRVVWSPPREPNGNLTGYRVAYGVRIEPQAFPFVSDNLSISDLSFYASGLVRRSFYAFAVTARTQLGWGEPAQLLVYTAAERTFPEAPYKPYPSQVGDRWIVITWIPRDNGYSLIRNFSVELRVSGGLFRRVEAYVAANLTEYKVTGLKPNSGYEFRVAAWNDVGMSNYSEPSNEVQTENSPPETAPSIISMVALTSTSVRVSWQPALNTTWNEVLLGFDVAYRESNSNKSWQVLTVGSPQLYYAVISNVQLFVVYEVKVRSFNSVGYSDYSPTAVIYVEIAPTAAVLNFQLLNVTSNAVTVGWDPPPRSDWNGNILGYKVFIWEVQMKSSKAVTVQAPATQTRLAGLIPFTNYSLTVQAFNSAGDGPNVTFPLNVTTWEDVPSPPGALRFVVPSPTSLNVSWNVPLFPNGAIQNYEVSFYQDFQLDGVSKSVQVMLTPEKTTFAAQQLIEGMSYVFSVRSRTSVGWSQPSTSRVTIGPQPGSPEAPRKPVCTVGDKSVTLTWVYGKPGDFPITGYLLEAQEKAEPTSWEVKLMSSAPDTTGSISLLAIKPKTYYRFRVIAINAVGIGEPSEASEFVRSVDILAEASKPFYQQWWFLVIVALIGAIVIILVISCLCLTGRRYKSKHQKAEKSHSSLSRTTLQMSRVRTPNPGATADNDDDDFSVFEVQRPARGSQRTLTRLPSNTRTTLSSRSSQHPPHPPRPSPGRVNYNFSEDRKSSDSSSLSEKASDVSTVRSHGSESDDNADKTFPPPAFPSHYVSGTVRNSLGRRNTYNPYAFADSEQDSGHYAMSLNGGHVMINNVAGSRAPLPGFSSFV